MITLKFKYFITTDNRYFVSESQFTGLIEPTLNDGRCGPTLFPISHTVEEVTEELNDVDIVIEESDIIEQIVEIPTTLEKLKK